MNMKRFMNKKVVAIGLAAGITLGGAGAAFAYFSTSGSGTGTGSVGNPSTVTISGVSTGAVTPGGQTGDVALSVTNPNSGNQLVTSVSLTSVDAFAGPGFTNPIPVGIGAGQCDTSQFSMATVTENYDAANGTNALPVHGVLVMADDTAHAQNGCAGAVLRLNLTSN
jgi:hypothetical protein